MIRLHSAGWASLEPARAPHLLPCRPRENSVGTYGVQFCFLIFQRACYSCFVLVTQKAQRGEAMGPGHTAAGEDFLSHRGHPSACSLRALSPCQLSILWGLQLILVGEDLVGSLLPASEKAC